MRPAPSMTVVTGLTAATLGAALDVCASPAKTSQRPYSSTEETLTDSISHIAEI